MGSVATRRSDFDEAQWETDSPAACRRYRLVFRDPKTPRIFDWARPCQSWLCGECAERKGGELIAHARTVFPRFVWHAAVGVAGDMTVERIRKRIAKRRARDAGAEFLAITQGEAVHVFASSPLVGREPPSRADGQQLAADAAGELLNGLLGERTRRRVAWSRGWLPPRRRSGLIPIADIGENWALFREAFEMAASIAEQRYGARPRLDIILPDQVPPDEFDDLLRSLLPLKMRRGKVSVSPSPSSVTPFGDIFAVPIDTQVAWLRAWAAALDWPAVMIGGRRIFGRNAWRDFLTSADIDGRHDVAAGLFAIDAESLTGEGLHV